MAIDIQTIGQQVKVNGEPLEPVEALRYARHLEEAARDALTTHMEDCVEEGCGTCASVKAFDLKTRLRSV